MGLKAQSVHEHAVAGPLQGKSRVRHSKGNRNSSNTTNKPNVTSLDLTELLDLAQSLPVSKPEKRILPNGLTLVTQELPGGDPICDVRFIVQTGSKNDQGHTSGLRHFMEHMNLRGTKTRSDTDIQIQLDKFGEDATNAFTNQELTGYEGQILTNDVPELVELFLDMLCNSQYTKKTIDIERGVIIQEIGEYFDNPSDHTDDLGHQAILKEHPFGRPIAGTEQTVSNITRKDFIQCSNDDYTLDNMTLSLTGKYDLDKVKRVIQRFEAENAHILTKRRSQCIELQPLCFTPGVVVKNRSLKETYIIFATKGIPVHDRRRYPFLIIENALCTGFASRLFTQIRQKRGFSYTVKSVSDLGSLGGIFAVFTGIPHSETGFVLDLILRELKDIKQNGLKEDELEKVKKQIIKKVIMDETDIEERGSQNSEEQYYHKRFIPLIETIESYLRVTNDDIVRLAREIFDPTTFALVAVGPKRKVTSKDNLQRIIDLVTTHWEQPIGYCPRHKAKKRY